jgi:hypothetical protein
MLDAMNGDVGSTQWQYGDVILGSGYAVGGCSAWESVYSLSNVAAYLTPASIEFGSWSGSAVQPSYFKCDNPDTVLTMLNSVLSGGTYSVVCRKHLWKTQMCGSSGVSLCVDCIDPCSTTCPSGSTINACKSDIFNCSGDVVHALTVSYAPVAALVKTAVSPASVSKTGFELAVTANRDCSLLVSCFLSGTVLRNSKQLLSQGQVFSIHNGSNVVDISSLVPSTGYDVYYQFQLFHWATNFSTVVQSKLSLTTACCREVTVQLLTDLVYMNQDWVNLATVSLSSLPGSNVTVMLSAIMLSTNVRYSLFPSSVQFTASSSAMSKTVSVGAAATGVAGAMQLSVSLTGSEASKYAVVYAGSQRFNTTTPGTPLPPPSFTIRFADDMTHLVTSFSGPTNHREYSTGWFSCWTVFNFAGVNQSSCHWEDSSSISIYLGASSEVIVGSIVDIQPHNSITASCATADCLSWPNVPAQSVSVLAPTNIILPVVSIQAPTTASICSSFAVDASGTSQSGGRPWKSVTWQLNCWNSTSCGSLSSLLPSSLTTVVSIASQVLGVGQYEFSVIICNFQGYCGVGVSRIDVVTTLVPTVTVYGPPFQVIQRNKKLTLNSQAVVQNCDGTTRMNSITYSWSVVVNNVVNVALKSESVSSQSFLTSPYVLSSNVVYTLVATAVDSMYKTSSSVSVVVRVAQGNLVARITGGTVRNLPQAVPTLLDGGGSYDEDVPAGAVSVMQYRWSCYTLKPYLNSSCSLSLLSSLTGSTLDVYGNVLASTSVVTLTVYDGTRSSQSSVQVAVVASSAPIVELGSTQSVINQGNVYSVTATVDANPYKGLNKGKNTSELVVVTTVCNWKSNDTGVSFAKNSLTPWQNVSLVSDESYFFNFMFALANDALMAGSTYLFTLDCTNGIEAYGSILVYVNMPPIPGKFAVTPGRGVALDTLFYYSATRWVDSDLPLMYSFAFQGSQYMQMLGDVSQQSSGHTYLPAGKDSDGYDISVVAVVLDSLNANTTRAVEVNVVPTNTTGSAGRRLADAGSSIDLDTLHRFVDNGLTLNDRTQFIQTLSIAIEMLNYVTCSAAPDCASLNREACSTTENSCGGCLSGYYGASGHGNTECVDSFQVTLLKVCASSSSCGSLEYCSSYGFCVPKNKECLNDCGGHGSCGFNSTMTGKEVSTCYAVDPTCRAVCRCDTGYAGEQCQHSVSTLEKRQYLRAYLLNKTTVMWGSSDISDIYLIMVSNTVAALSAHYDELNYEYVVNVETVIWSVINVSSVTVSDYTYIASTLSAIDQISQAVAVVGSPSDSMVVYNLLNVYAGMVLDNLVDGQSSVIFAYDTFQLVFVAKAVRASSAPQSIAASSPLLTAFGNYLQNISIGQSFHSFSVSFKTSSAASLKAMVGIVGIGSYGTGASGFSGNPLVVRLGANSLCSSGDCNVTVTLPNIDAEKYYETSTITYKDVCTVGVEKNYSHYCVNAKTTIHSHCDGSFDGNVVSRCPWKKFAPDCSILLDSDASSDSSCTATSYDSMSTTCMCVGAGSSNRRRLLTSDSTAWQNNSANGLQFVTQTMGTTQTLDPYYATYAPTAVPTQKPSDSRPVPRFVLYGAAALGALVCLVCVASVWRSRSKLDKQRAEDELKEIGLGLNLRAGSKKGTVGASEDNTSVSSAESDMSESLMAAHKLNQNLRERLGLPLCGLPTRAKSLLLLDRAMEEHERSYMASLIEELSAENDRFAKVLAMLGVTAAGETVNLFSSRRPSLSRNGSNNQVDDDRSLVTPDSLAANSAVVSGASRRSSLVIDISLNQAGRKAASEQNSKDYANRMLEHLERQQKRQPLQAVAGPKVSDDLQPENDHSSASVGVTIEGPRREATRSPRRSVVSQSATFNAPKVYHQPVASIVQTSLQAPADGDINVTATVPATSPGKKLVRRGIAKIRREEVKLDTLLKNENDTVFDLSLEGIPLGNIDKDDTRSALDAAMKGARSARRLTKSGIDLSLNFDAVRLPERALSSRRDSVRSDGGDGSDAKMTAIVDKRRGSVMSRSSLGIDVGGAGAEASSGSNTGVDWVVAVGVMSPEPELVPASNASDRESSEKKRRPRPTDNRDRLRSPAAHNGASVAAKTEVSAASIRIDVKAGSFAEASADATIDRPVSANSASGAVEKRRMRPMRRELPSEGQISSPTRGEDSGAATEAPITVGSAGTVRTSARARPERLNISVSGKASLTAMSSLGTFQEHHGQQQSSQVVSRPAKSSALGAINKEEISGGVAELSALTMSRTPRTIPLRRPLVTTASAEAANSTKQVDRASQKTSVADTAVSVDQSTTADRVPGSGTRKVRRPQSGLQMRGPTAVAAGAGEDIPKSPLFRGEAAARTALSPSSSGPVRAQEMPKTQPSSNSKRQENRSKDSEQPNSTDFFGSAF